MLLAAGLTYAGVTASISGTVTDSSGAAIAGATVTATNAGTGVVTTQQTNAAGFYSFQSLPVGTYTIEVEQKGFKSYKQTGVVVDVNSALVVDVALQGGQAAEMIEVSSFALHVDTASTQMGKVITGQHMTDVPLDGRSYTDLLPLQPGVVSQQSGMNGGLGGEFTSAGFSPPAVSGNQNAGGYSINGMREAANGFLLNGILVQETGFSGAGAIPNLDSIAEFRIITNNFDAEYGNYARGQINVVTKSGTNDWHGNAFEFFRNTNLDIKNRLPYAEQYEVFLERQITSTNLLTVSYVGSQGHRLLSSESANPGIPSLCLSLLAAGCGPGGENNIYTLKGVTTAGMRGPFSAPYRNTPVNGSYIVPSVRVARCGSRGKKINRARVDESRAGSLALTPNEFSCCSQFIDDEEYHDWTQRSFPVCLCSGFLGCSRLSRPILGAILRINAG